MTETDSAALVAAGHDDAPSALELRSHTPGVASMRVESVGGRSVVVVRIDNSRRRGALAPIDGENIAEAARMALDKRLPLLLFMTSSGADANEGVAALHGWGIAARVLTRCSGTVPIIAIVEGGAVSGSALLIGLADVVIMTRDAYAFVSGPIGVRQLT
ncbi:MAG: carboxyl transferase domain-containing protein, partial [Actinomycetota bacterium]|nr:carboxyl transferase domain-containing protein [Actinomycetota bacterium]